VITVICACLLLVEGVESRLYFLHLFWYLAWDSVGEACDGVSPSPSSTIEHPLIIQLTLLSSFFQCDAGVAIVISTTQPSVDPHGLDLLCTPNQPSANPKSEPISGGDSSFRT
jgi:hypothetical protein